MPSTDMLPSVAGPETKGKNESEEDYLTRVAKSRAVLYDIEKRVQSGKHYVDTYDQFWADHYNQDGEQLGFTQAWSNAVSAIQKYVPDTNALILDFCGGTGQVGKRLHALGYKNLHIADGSIMMLKQAILLGVYKQFFVGVVDPNETAEYLRDVRDKYDCILSSMSLSEFKPNVEMMITQCLKPGGVFISLEAEPHIEKAHLSGIAWILSEWADESKRDSLPFKVICDDNSVRHDHFTEDAMKLLVVQRK